MPYHSGVKERLQPVPAAGTIAVLMRGEAHMWKDTDWIGVPQEEIRAKRIYQGDSNG